MLSQSLCLRKAYLSCRSFFGEGEGEKERRVRELDWVGRETANLNFP